MPQSGLQLINAVAARSNRALFEPLSFACTPGMLVHLSGANGSGKTTLIRTICGFHSLQAGEILWNGREIDGNEDFYLNSAYLGHRDAHAPLQTAWESLRFYQRLYSSDASAKDIDPLLQRMDLLHQADVVIAKLSFGQKRKLAIARLLLSGRNLWLLDEPFSGVDADGRRLIEDICAQHLLADGMILMTNHGAVQNAELLQRLTQVQLT